MNLEKLKAQLLSLRDLLSTAWWIILIVGAGFFAAFHFVKPAPPNHIIISTGAAAVSYTHLDVYKRQGLYRPGAPTPSRKGFLQRVQESNLPRAGLTRPPLILKTS